MHHVSFDGATSIFSCRDVTDVFLTVHPLHFDGARVVKVSAVHVLVVHHHLGIFRTHITLMQCNNSEMLRKVIL